MTDVAQGAPQGNAPAPTAQEPQKYTIKTDGREEQLTLDELMTAASHGRAANKRFREASDLAKSIEPYKKYAERAKSGDLDWLSEIADDDSSRKWAENRLLKHIEYQQMSPDQKALMQERQRATQLEAELKSKTATEQKALLQQAEYSAANEIDSEISSALKELGRKPSPRLVKRIAEDILASLERNQGPRMTAQEALKRNVAGFKQDITEYLSDMPIDQLKEVLPKKILDALRKADLDLARTQDPIRSAAPRSKEGKDVDYVRFGDKKMKKMKTDDWFSAMEKRFQKQA